MNLDAVPSYSGFDLSSSTFLQVKSNHGVVSLLPRPLSHLRKMDLHTLTAFSLEKMCTRL